MSKITKNKYSCKEDYFKNINSPTKAYWLGFLYADANVRHRKPNEENYNGFAESYSLNIELASKDNSHIKKFKSDINADNPIKTGREYKNGKLDKMTIYNSYFIKNLIDKGCVPNKTNKIKFPSFIKDSLKNHFIRGYFDGDGYVGIYPESSQCYVGFSGNKLFSRELKNVISNNFKFRLDLNNRESRTELIIRTISRVSKFYKWLYKRSKRFLYRKKDKMKKIYNSESFSELE